MSSPKRAWQVGRIRGSLLPGALLCALVAALALALAGAGHGALRQSAPLNLFLPGVTDEVAGAVQDMEQAAMGESEKTIGGDKELAQAELNGEAIAASGEHAGADGGMAPDACTVLETEGDAVDAQVSAELWTKALTASDARRAVGVDSPGGTMRATLDNHNYLYCSDADEARRRCAVPGNGMQDADVQAATMMVPNAGSTLSDEEFAASRQFVHNVTDAIPAQNLPPAIERSAAGQAYLLAQRRNAAQLSLADYALNQIIASQRVRN